MVRFRQRIGSLNRISNMRNRQEGIVRPTGEWRMGQTPIAGKHNGRLLPNKRDTLWPASTAYATGRARRTLLLCFHVANSIGSNATRFEILSLSLCLLVSHFFHVSPILGQIYSFCLRCYLSLTLHRAPTIVMFTLFLFARSFTFAHVPRCPCASHLVIR